MTQAARHDPHRRSLGVVGVLLWSGVGVALLLVVGFGVHRALDDLDRDLNVDQAGAWLELSCARGAQYPCTVSVGEVDVEPVAARRDHLDHDRDAPRIGFTVAHRVDHLVVDDPVDRRARVMAPAAARRRSRPHGRLRRDR